MKALKILAYAVAGICKAPFICLYWLGIWGSGLLLALPAMAGGMKELDSSPNMVRDEPGWVAYRACVGLLCFVLFVPCLVWWLVRAFARVGGFVPPEDCALDWFLPPKVSCLRNDDGYLRRWYPRLAFWLSFGDR